jgi:aryl-alcohol dehydrogenase-like predicted oxidoreductase
MTFGEPDRARLDAAGREQPSDYQTRHRGGINFFDTANSYSDGSSEDCQIVSRLCLGCMTFGEPPRHHAWTLPEESSRPIIQHALKAALTSSIPQTATPTAAAKRSSAARCGLRPP